MMMMMSEQPPDEEGANLAAQFFKALSDRNISLDLDDDDDDDDDDDEDDSNSSSNNTNDEEEDENADDDDDAILREYDVPTSTGEDGITMGELTDTQIYDEMKDRVLESAGAFVELASVSMVGVGDDDDYDDEDDDGALVMVGGRGENLGIDAKGGGDGMYYRPPTIVPDSGLTAGEVVELGELSVCV